MSAISFCSGTARNRGLSISVVSFPPSACNKAACMPAKSLRDCCSTDYQTHTCSNPTRSCCRHGDWILRTQKPDIFNYKEKERKITPLGIIMGASRPGGSPGIQLYLTCNIDMPRSKLTFNVAVQAVGMRTCFHGSR